MKFFEELHNDLVDINIMLNEINEILGIKQPLNDFEISYIKKLNHSWYEL